jgi:hypothetical protein
MKPLDAARGIALGRVALGAGLLLAPSTVARPWVGAAADRPGAQVALRGFGARDVVLGGIALHLAGRGPAGPRALQACAVVDAVDAAATLAQRRDLPPLGAAAVVALAAGGAVAQVVVARALSGR